MTCYQCANHTFLVGSLIVGRNPRDHRSRPGTAHPHGLFIARRRNAKKLAEGIVAGDACEPTVRGSHRSVKGVAA